MQYGAELAEKLMILARAKDDWRGARFSIEGPSHSCVDQSSQVGWKRICERLIRIDWNDIAQIALDLVDESGEPREASYTVSLDRSQLWGMIGGLQGVEALEVNSEVLIDLAFHAQQWDPESLVIAERMRLDARKLKWYVARLKGAAQTGNLEVSFPFYAQRAIVSYYLMTRRLLGLYAALDVRRNT